MSFIQPVKFGEMETRFYNIVIRVKSCFKMGIFDIGFTLAFLGLEKDKMMMFVQIQTELVCIVQKIRSNYRVSSRLLYTIFLDASR